MADALTGSIGHTALAPILRMDTAPVRGLPCELLDLSADLNRSGIGRVVDVDVVSATGQRRERKGHRRCAAASLYVGQGDEDRAVAAAGADMDVRRLTGCVRATNGRDRDGGAAVTKICERCAARLPRVGDGCHRHSLHRRGGRGATGTEREAESK